MSVNHLQMDANYLRETQELGIPKGCIWHSGFSSSSKISSLQFGSVTQSCPTLCDPMNRSTPSILKTVKVIGNKENLRNCHSQEESLET